MDSTSRSHASKISIHVLRVEDDVNRKELIVSHQISIHVLRVEDDYSNITKKLHHSNFNPRPPCGGRPGWEVVKREV